MEQVDKINETQVNKENDVEAPAKSDASQVDNNNAVIETQQSHASAGETKLLVPEFSRKLSLDDSVAFVNTDSSKFEQDNIGKSSRNEKLDFESPAVFAESPTQRDAAETGSTSTCFTPNQDSGKNDFICLCGKKFEKSVQLAAHKRWSCPMKEKTAQCEVCKTWFASEMGLRRHMKHVHGGVFSCDKCLLRFHNKIKLTRHWMEAHHDEEREGSKKLKCYECGDTNFDSKFELECHLVVHKYEKHQQKIARNSSWSPQAPCFYPPYPAARFTGPHPHHRFPHRPPYEAFAFRHPSHHPPFPPPFMHRPFFPPPPPPPPFYPIQGDGDSSLQSVASSDNAFESTHPCEDVTSRSTQGNQNTPASNTSHNHTYVEPTACPPFLSPRMFRNYGHPGKMKWKKYLKLMMKGKVPPLWARAMHPHADTVQKETRDQEPLKPNWMQPDQRFPKDPNSDPNPSEFKIACKFCDKVIERNKISWHQRRECPVLSEHRCSVCDRVFRKRHFLIRHMHEQNHFRVGSSGPQSTTTIVSDDPSTLSSLQEKMNHALKQLSFSDTRNTKERKQEGLSSNQSEMQINCDEPCKESKEQCNQPCVPPETEMQCSNASSLPNEKRNSNGTGKENIAQCNICKFVARSNLELSSHLREHLNQVLSIQKVQEWTNKSSEYFLLGAEDDEIDNDVATSITTSSYLDSDIISASESTTADMSSNFSSLETTASKDPIWMKPHKKSHGHRVKGEITVCDVCGDQFSFRKDLKFHMETKHKGCTLECPICKKKFSWKQRGKFYERHLQSHYGVKVFKHQCSVCGKHFLENSKLRAHMALHKNELLHKCSVCGKGYANKSSLVRHERKHTGEKPYQCDVCQESFMEKRELLRHSTTHTGILPFSCEICAQGFTLKTSLVAHMKKKHAK